MKWVELWWFEVMMSVIFSVFAASLLILNAFHFTITGAHRSP